MTDINLFLVDDHKLFLTGVETELSEQFPIVGTAGDVDEAIAAIRRSEPDVVLVDVHMPGGGGVTVIRNVLESHPDTKFLALSVPTRPRTSLP